MAVTVTQTALPGYSQPETHGRIYVRTVEWTLAGTYATGGYAYAAQDFGAPAGSSILALEFPDGSFRNGTNMIDAVWDRTNKKVMLFWVGTAGGNPKAEVTNGTSVASYVGRVKARYLE